MFTELHAMAKAAMLLITATADGDRLRISISPSYPDGKVPAGAVALRPLSLVGTPDELNADFAAVLNLWQAPKRSILEQAQDQVDEQADEADAPKSTGKTAGKAPDTDAKGKRSRKSAPAAVAPQDKASAQPQNDIDSSAGDDSTDAQAAQEEGVAAEPAAEPAAPASVAEPAAPAPAVEPIAPVDVYTIDLF